VTKRVYFAFHYQDVIDLRANVVRNHNMPEGVRKAGYFDSSIWESAKNTNDLSLKRLINTELEGTSVTAVLIGSLTYARPWVRYEIFKSIERGNIVLGIHINGIAGRDRQTKTPGPNPFDNLGLVVSDDGSKGSPTEWNGTQWVVFDSVSPFKISTQQSFDRGRHFPLSKWISVYDWVQHNGYNNFRNWIR